MSLYRAIQWIDAADGRPHDIGVEELDCILSSAGAQSFGKLAFGQQAKPSSLDNRAPAAPSAAGSPEVINTRARYRSTAAGNLSAGRPPPIHSSTCPGPQL